MSDLTLYQISAEIEAALMADEFDEEALSALVVSMESKAGAVVAVRDKVLSFADLCKSEVKRITALQKSAENKAARMLQYLQDNMDVAGVAEVKVGTKTAKIQKNPGKVVIDDEELLPALFVVIEHTKKIDKAGIKDALKTVKVPGAHLEQGFSLRIR